MLELAPAVAPVPRRVRPPVRVRALPGVYRPQEDSALLASRLVEEDLAGADVLDVCTGTGMLATLAAVCGAGSVTAVDRSRRAVLCARMNLRANGVRGRVLLGDLAGRLGDRRFDVVVSNPPYVPSRATSTASRGVDRAWDAGPDGRELLDRICEDAPRRLRPGGRLLLVHSAVADEGRTVAALEAGGLEAEVAARRTIAFGPVLRARAAWLRETARLGADDDLEELVVVRARRPADDR